MISKKDEYSKGTETMGMVLVKRWGLRVRWSWVALLIVSAAATQFILSLSTHYVAIPDPAKGGQFPMQRPSSLLRKDGHDVVINKDKHDARAVGKDYDDDDALLRDRPRPPPQEYPQEQQDVVPVDLPAIAFKAPVAPQIVFQSAQINKSTHNNNIDQNSSTQCPSNRRIVYLKTHKTGSSTLTNIFHRFALKYSLRVVLPKGNLFLGWPKKANIKKSFIELPTNLDEHYDVFCSAHARYDRSILQEVVPDSQFVTVLRNPVSHIVSSWNYWGVASHILEVSGKHVTLQQFISSPGQWWDKAKKSDKDLIYNGMSFDLGLDHNATKDDVDALIHQISKDFAMVLITEHMDESLVMLKRRLCWDLDDIVHASFKVVNQPHNGNEAPKALVSSPTFQRQALAMNWKDKLLYDYFNRTLWKAIDQEPAFEYELQQFKERKAEVTSRCMNYTQFSDDIHRKELLESPSTATEVAQCHLQLLDSGGFVKYLKKRSGIEELECKTQGRKRKQIVYIKTHKTGSSTITNMLHRFAVKHRLKVVLPKNNLYLGWPRKDDLASSYTRLPGVKSYNVFCSGHSRLQTSEMEQLVPNGNYITSLRDPVKHFLSAWHYWHVEDHILESTGQRVSMVDFLKNPEPYLPHVNEKLIHNSMTFDLGLQLSPAHEDVTRLIANLNSFAAVLITEYMDESLVLMRRKLCWDGEDISHIPIKVSPVQAYDSNVDASTADLIRKFNWADTMLYDHFNRTLWRQLQDEIDLVGELHNHKQENQKWAKTCEPFKSESDREHRRVLTNAWGNKIAKSSITNEERTCRMMILDSMDFVKLLKFRAHVKEAECHTQGQKAKNMVFIKTHKTGGSTLTNIFHRFGLFHDLGFALPKDNVFYGWPLKEQLKDSIDHPEQGKANNLLVSAHARYSPSINDIVPNAKYITVLRDPVDHFLSSWSHWHVSDHIVANGGPKISPEEFSANPSAFWNYTKWTDKYLIRNGMSFDLGLDVEAPSKDEIEAFVSTIARSFHLVLITEYMDESLVLLRRMLCWDMEDILYIALKVAAHQTFVKETPLLRNQVEKANPVDTMIYKHFNATLWDHISKEVDFSSELAEFKSLVLARSNQCEEYSNQYETEIRKYLVESRKPLGTDKKSLCFLTLLDSQGFVKLLKQRRGSSLLECHGSLPYPDTKALFVPVQNVPSLPVQLRMDRYTQASNSNFDSAISVVHKDSNITDTPTHLSTFIQTQPNSHFDISFNLTIQFEIDEVIKYFPSAKRITLLQDPRRRFCGAWRRLNVQQALLQVTGQRIDVGTFTRSPEKYLKVLPHDIGSQLQNGMARQLGVNVGSQSPKDVPIVEEMMNNFDLIMISEHLQESLVMMRRLLCWGPGFLSNAGVPNVPTSEAEVLQGCQPDDRLIGIDKMIYKASNKSLWEQIGREVAFESELSQFRRQN